MQLLVFVAKLTSSSCYSGTHCRQACSRRSAFDDRRIPDAGDHLDESCMGRVSGSGPPGADLRRDEAMDRSLDGAAARRQLPRVHGPADRGRIDRLQRPADRPGAASHQRPVRGHEQAERVPGHGPGSDAGHGGRSHLERRLSRPEHGPPTAIGSWPAPSKGTSRCSGSRVPGSISPARSRSRPEATRPTRCPAGWRSRATGPACSWPPPIATPSSRWTSPRKSP